MNYNVISQVHKAINLTPPEKSVLLHLAVYADNNGDNVYPSKVTLTELTGYTRKTVRLAIESLEAKGILSKQPGIGPRGQYKYKINLESLETRTPPKPRPSKKAADQQITAPNLDTEEPPNNANMDTGEPPINRELDTSEPPQSANLDTGEPRLSVNNDLNNLDYSNNLSNLSSTDHKKIDYVAVTEKPKTDPVNAKAKTQPIEYPPDFDEYLAEWDAHQERHKRPKAKYRNLLKRDLAGLVRELQDLPGNIRPADFRNALINQDLDTRFTAYKSPLSYKTRTINEKNLRIYGEYFNPSDSDRFLYNIMPNPTPAETRSVSGIGWETTETYAFSPDPGAEDLAGESKLNVYAAAILDIYQEITGQSYSPDNGERETIDLWEKIPFTLDDYKNALDKMAAAMGLDRINSPVACEYYLKIAKQERISPDSYKSLNDLRGYRIPSMIGV